MYYLGIDGGQSSTTAVVGDERGRLLGWGVGGPSDHVSEPGGVERLRKAIVASVRGALRGIADRPLSRVRFRSAYCGMTGDPREHERVLTKLICAERLVVEHDSVIALAGATAGAPGIVVIAGTGSVALGVNERGERWRVGGWGYLFGDEGSAFDIARRGVMACLKHRDGRAPATLILEKILVATGANDLGEVLKAVYSGEMPRDRLAALAVSIGEAAEEGDRVARTILREAGEQLAILAMTIFRRLGGFGERVLIAHVGGVFENRFVRDRFRDILSARVPSAEVIPPRFQPVIGALLLAYREGGVAMNEERMQNLRRSLERWR